MKKKFTLVLCLVLAAFLGLSLASGCARKQAATDYAATDKPMAAYDNGWYAVYKITDNIYAIGEPLYFQANYSYLVIGEERALMLDSTASITRNVVPVIRTLTDKPLAVMPTHMHFDHIGGLHNFDEIWFANTPIIASFKQADGKYFIPPSHSLSFIDNYKIDDIPPVTVSRLVDLGEVIDLGGTKLRVMHAPGHCQDEIVVYDETDNILFSGDYICPPFLINGNAAEYAASTDRVLGLINDKTLILAGHTSDKTPSLVPVLRKSDVLDLKNFLAKLQNKELTGEIISDEVYKIKSAKAYEVNDRIGLVDEIVWENGTAYNY